MRSALVAVLGSTLLLSTGCTFSAGGPKAVSSDSLEKKVSSALAKEAGQTPDDVSCPKDLKAKKGATVRCVLTAGSDKLGVTVTTTSVDGGRVKFNAQVDKTMTSSAAS